MPDFSGYDGEEAPEAIAGGLAGETDRIRYAVRKFGGRVFLGVFDTPDGRRQYLAPARGLPLSEGAGPLPVSSDSGVSGRFFQFPFTALDEWWAKVGVCAAAESWIAM